MVWVSFCARSIGRCGRSIALMVALASAFAIVAPVRAATVPFTETFAADAANWAIDAAGTEAQWNATGGPSGGTFIARSGSGPDQDFGFFQSGPTLFRGQDSFDSSGDAFVGDWLTAGVGTFSVDVFHDHSSDLEFTVRLADPSNNPGASSIGFLVTPNTWTTLNIPIVDSASSFQSYGSLGSAPNASSFSSIFDNIGNIQIGLSFGQVGAGIPATFGLANPMIAPVPEPSTWVVLAGAVVSGLVIRRRRHRERRDA